MAEKRSSRGRGRAALRRLLSGTGIALVGFAGGLVAGSILEGPRLLLQWLRGPVRSVELAALPPAPVEAGPLRELADLHRPAARRPRTPPPEPAPSSPAAAPPRPAAPAGDVLSDLRREVAERPAPASPPASPPAAAAPAPPAAVQRTPVVQVASTSDAAEAQRIVARLRASGFEAFSVAVRTGSGPTHRVRVRTTGGEAATALAERLRAQGFETWITQD